MLIQQRASFELTLRNRLSFLSERGLTTPKAEKDTIVRKLKADIKAVNKRLRTVAEHDKRTEELATTKAERKAAPRKEQEAAKSEKPKKAGEEGKGKKTKPEGGKPQKKAEAAGEGKPEIKKKAEAAGEGKPEIKKKAEGASEGPAGQAKTPAKP
jgi:membrane protein involved in colicin uptake